MLARHLLELRKEIVRAWMRIEEKEWKKSREEWKQEANALEKEFLKDELKRVQQISADPPHVAPGAGTGPVWIFLPPPQAPQSRTYHPNFGSRQG